MFASLVIIFPTAHQGGSLLFRHGTFAHTFDSATAVAEAAPPSIAFAAFYSDIDHEVSLVKSGYRVTLTYNLYYNATSRPRFDNPFSETQESPLRFGFTKLLADKTFLPKGGYIAFGMAHRHATDNLSIGSLSSLINLKGKDAIVMKVCKELSLEAKVQVMYDDLPGIDGRVLCDSVFPSGGYYEEYDTWGYTLRKVGGKTTQKGVGRQLNIPVVDVVWATPAESRNICNQVEASFITYGNEASMGNTYGIFCFLVKSPPAGKRKVAHR